MYELEPLQAHDYLKLYPTPSSPKRMMTTTPASIAESKNFSEKLKGV